VKLKLNYYCAIPKVSHTQNDKNKWFPFLFFFFFSSACKIFCLKAKIQLRSGHGVQKRDNCSSAALSGFAKATISKRQTHL
jgi:hypothetical protein